MDTNTNDNQSVFNATDSKTPKDTVLDIVLARTNVGKSYLVKADVVEPKRHQYIYAFKDIEKEED